MMRAKVYVKERNHSTTATLNSVYKLKSNGS